MSTDLRRRSQHIRDQSTSLGSAWPNVDWRGPNRDAFQHQLEDAERSLNSLADALDQAAADATNFAKAYGDEIHYIHVIEGRIRSWLHSEWAGLAALGIAIANVAEDIAYHLLGRSLPAPGSREWHEVERAARSKGFGLFH
jgi:uncharacterized protein YukE